jgi:hypothetical protein
LGKPARRPAGEPALVEASAPDLTALPVDTLLDRGLDGLVRDRLGVELEHAQGHHHVDDLIGDAITWPNLAHADTLARIVAELRLAPHDPPARVADNRVPLSAGKLAHDIEQLEWLAAQGEAIAGSSELLAAYTRALARFEGQPGEYRLALAAAADPLIERCYGRLLHLAEGARVGHALSPAWSGEQVEALYLNQAPGIVVIDQFLTPEALRGLRHFCLASTIWNANRYGYGRLGAFVRDGFTCPLLFQIAEELRARLPRVLDAGLPLKQLWGFKNAATMPPDAAIHADFAAVNVNFWITPTEANADPDTGGMTIFTMDAPPEWDFDMYNAQSDLIHDFLRRNLARRLRVPYRGNRAILFNSDLFHGTEKVDFHPGYENRRVNVTFLYGQRENDRHHPMAPPASAWRSQAFRRI